MFAQLALPWFVKYPAILAIGFAIMIASYHFMVRGTAIGVLLNGRRYGKAAAMSGKQPTRSGQGGSRLVDDA